MSVQKLVVINCTFITFRYLAKHIEDHYPEELEKLLCEKEMEAKQQTQNGTKAAPTASTAQDKSQG